METKNSQKNVKFDPQFDEFIEQKGHTVVNQEEKYISKKFTSAFQDHTKKYSNMLNASNLRGSSHDLSNHPIMGPKTQVVNRQKGLAPLFEVQAPKIMRKSNMKENAQEDSMIKVHKRLKTFTGLDKENMESQQQAQYCLQKQGTLSKMKEMLAADLSLQKKESSQPSERLQRLKPLSLDRNKVQEQDFKNLDGFGSKQPLSGMRSGDTSPTSGFKLFAPSILKKKTNDPNTATHRFDNKTSFMLAPDAHTLAEPDSAFPVADSAMLPLGSGIPKLNARKINKDIQVSNKKEKAPKQKLWEVKTPLTAFNNREKQYKNRSLSGTYGKNYKSPVKEENEEFNSTANPTMSLRTKREIGDQRKEFNELTKDLNFKNQSAIPNSFLHQPEAERTRWMLKRGKDKMVYYDNSQISKMKKYFEELDTDRSGMIGPNEIEETLISLGLAKNEDDVQDIVDELDQDGNGELDFDEFLQMLKDTSMRNFKGNFLTDRNLLFQKAKYEKSKSKQILGDGKLLQTVQLPNLNDGQAYVDFNPQKYFEQLRSTHNKALDVKENCPKYLKSKKDQAKKVAQKKIKADSVSSHTHKVFKEVSQSEERSSYLSTKYKTSMDVASTSHLNADLASQQQTSQASLSQFTAFQSQISNHEDIKNNRRKFKNSKDDICNFFNNLTKVNGRSKSGDAMMKKNGKKVKQSKNIDNIPFQLLMSNFRRKKILETLKDKKISYDDKDEILKPYEDYIERVLDQFQDIQIQQEESLAASSYYADIKRGNHLGGNTGVALDSKRVIRETEEDDENESSQMSETLGEDTEKDLYSQFDPSIMNESKMSKKKQQKYSVKDPMNLKNKKINLEQLKKEIYDTNSSYLLDQSKELSVKGGLVTFGPKLNKSTEPEQRFSYNNPKVSKKMQQQDSKDSLNQELTEKEMQISDSDGSDKSDNYSEENQDQMSESSVSTHLQNNRVQFQETMSLNKSQMTGMFEMVSPRIQEYNRLRQLDIQGRKKKCAQMGAVSTKSQMKRVAVLSNKGKYNPQVFLDILKN